MFVLLFNLYWLCIVLLQRHVHEVLLAKHCSFQYLCLLFAGFVMDVDETVVTN
jgi:hypothetical protein